MEKNEKIVRIVKISDNLSKGQIKAKRPNAFLQGQSVFQKARFLKFGREKAKLATLIFTVYVFVFIWKFNFPIIF